MRSLKMRRGIFFKNKLAHFVSGLFLGLGVTGIFIHIGEIIDSDNTSIMSIADFAGKSIEDIHQSKYERNRHPAKIHCIVLSNLENSTEKAETVRKTWGKRCNSMFFLTSSQRKYIPTVLLPENIPDTRNNLWEKTKMGFSSAYSNFFQADWYLKADDDTYIVMDNLRALLNWHNASDPLYFGCRLTGGTKNGYMSGGSGYVLSREALRRFIENALHEYECSKGWSEYEDINVAYCLEAAKVKFVDTRDLFGRERFFPLIPFSRGLGLSHAPQINSWYWTRMFFGPPKGVECCSESLISFHYVHSIEMEMAEFFLYHLSPNQR